VEVFKLRGMANRYQDFIASGRYALGNLLEMWAQSAGALANDPECSAVVLRQGEEQVDYKPS
jgi:hypothetical protein